MLMLAHTQTLISTWEKAVLLRSKEVIPEAISAASGINWLQTYQSLSRIVEVKSREWGLSLGWLREAQLVSNLC